MSKLRSKRRYAGFTLVELLIGFAIMTILLTIGIPTLYRTILRSSFEGFVREAALLTQRARLEAIKRNVSTVIIADPTDRTVFAFTDVDGPTEDDPGDLLYNPVAGEPRLATDYPIGTITAPTSIIFGGPGGGGLADGLSTVDGESVIVFNPDGSVAAVGGYRFGDQRDLNHLELRIAPAASGRVTIRKYNIDDDAWYASGGSTRSWEWY